MLEEINYMTADEEDLYKVATANEPLNPDGTFINDRITVRDKAEIIAVPVSQVDYIDVSPRQVVSVATAMVPFLESDDATRALMGSNMQRQAVPLLVPEAPLVATGMEYRAAHDSGVCLLAKEDGVVEKVDAVVIFSTLFLLIKAAHRSQFMGRNLICISEHCFGIQNLGS